MKLIPVGEDRFATVSDQDYHLVADKTWFLSNKGYAISSTHVEGHIVNFYMHRVIAGVDGDQIVDHRDRDRLNNTRENLRVCDHTLNNGNLPKRRGCVSRFKGVSWSKQKAKWHARIKFKGVSRNLGFFSDEVDAARAYNAAAPQVFGEFARLNPL